MRKLLCLAATLMSVATSVAALDVDHDAIRARSLSVIETQFTQWRDANSALEITASGYCDDTMDRAELDAAVGTAWRAWAPLDSYQFGPIEQTSAVFSVNFWPDKKNFVGKALRQLVTKPEADQRLPATVGALSSAAQGYPAIEMLLHSDMPECPAIIGISGHISLVADDLLNRWFGPQGWAELARSAGPENPVYLSAEEFTKTLFTAADFGLTRIKDQRLGRPLGTPTLPFPKRAEAWRSGLTNDLIAAQLDGVSTLVRDGFGPDIPAEELATFLDGVADVHQRLIDLNMPLGQAVENPMDRFRVEVVQTQVLYLQTLLATEVGPSLGVKTGFSAADGD